MNTKSMRVLAAVAAGSMIVTPAVEAVEPQARKNETIYVTKDGNQVMDQTVSVWLNGDKGLKIKDRSDLKEIKNLETDEAVQTQDGYIQWNAQESFHWM